MSTASASGINGSGGSARGLRLGYVPALDGLRALAVIAVILYHAGATWLPGGFLGVEVFFVISGYLITALLLAEWNLHGSIDLKGFWLRRARRLLPAVFVLLLSVLAFAVIFLPDEVAGLRGDALAATGYATNWYLILSHKSYFEVIGRPSLLRHLWSLAVEEQFYLVWPLLFLGLVRLLRTRFGRVAVVLAVAAASTWLMAALYQPDADPSRVYYGTDTRAAGLLIGAALALVWQPRRGEETDGAAETAGRRRWLRRLQVIGLELFGAAALAAVGWYCHFFSEYEPLLYRGGFAVIGLTTAALIFAAVHPRTRILSRVLGFAPLRWMGTRSYGIYLWHWPVFMVTRPQLDVTIDGLPLLALRMALTLSLAELSYRLIETPIRQGALGRSWHDLRSAHGRQRGWLVVRWGAAALSMAAFSVALGESVVSAQPPAPPSYLMLAEASLASSQSATASLNAASVVDAARPGTLVGVTLPAAAPAGQVAPDWRLAPGSQANTSVSPAPAEAAGVVTNTTSSPPAPPVAEPPAIAPGPALTGTQVTTRTVQTLPGTDSGESHAAPRRAPEITAVGDSVMLGASEQLRQDLPTASVDAVLGRQAAAFIDLLRTRRDAGELGQVVVIHAGNNGPVSARQFDEIMKLLDGVKQVIFINDKVPRQWEETNNRVLAEGVQRFPSATLVDWRAASQDRPELFWDGIHVRADGAKLYASLIAGAIK